MALYQLAGECLRAVPRRAPEASGLVLTPVIDTNTSPINHHHDRYWHDSYLEINATLSLLQERHRPRAPFNLCKLGEAHAHKDFGDSPFRCF